MFQKEREQLFRAHIELKKNHLVSGSSGNISMRLPEKGLFLIKPSGVGYEELSPEIMVLIDENGLLIEKNGYTPSVDTETHLFLYKNRPELNAIIHTHSPFATAFAVVGKPIPVVLTAIADMFGGPIPCGKFARVGGSDIGKEILSSAIESPAVLIQQHGVFAFHKCLNKALKVAIAVEEFAKTIYYASHLGKLTEIPKEEIEFAYDFHQKNYGQCDPIQSQR